MKRKKCPLLIHSNTHQSIRIPGESWTRTYFLECIGEECAAYDIDLCSCLRFFGFDCVKNVRLEEE